MTVFLKDRIKLIYGNQGITLIEVLVVLVLLAVVLAPAVNAIATTNRVWSHNKAINPSITQANLSMTWLSREIRGATQPSSTVDSVLVEDTGQRLIIYHYNENTSEWEKIIYQINADNQLRKIILSEPDPAAILSAGIPDDSDSGWITLLEGVTSNPVFNRPANSRTVEINLEVSDSGQVNPRFAPYNLASTYMIRSREVGAITGDPVPDETEPAVVPVTKVVVNPGSTTLVMTGLLKKHEQEVSATIWPANATDKSVIWKSSNEEWVRVEYDPANSLTAKIILNKVAVSPPSSITVTATANGGGTNGTCTVSIHYLI